MNVLSSRGETPILEGDRRGNDPRDDENSSSTDRAVKTERRDGVARIAIGLGVRDCGVSIAADFRICCLFDEDGVAIGVVEPLLTNVVVRYSVADGVDVTTCGALGALLNGLNNQDEVHRDVKDSLFGERCCSSSCCCA